MRFECAAGALCLDFANTIHDWHAEDNGEELRDVSDLLEWAKDTELLSSADHGRLTVHFARHSRDAAAALAAAITTRDLMIAIFSGVARGGPVSFRRLSELNVALADTPGVLRLHKHAGRIDLGWESAADGMERVRFAVLTSAAQLLASDRVARVRECASAECTWLFVDESRNRSRRWCDMSVCGNRMKARRHYQRAKTPDSARKSRIDDLSSVR